MLGEHQDRQAGNADRHAPEYRGDEGRAQRGLAEAVVQSTEIGAVNSWLRNQPAQVVLAAIASLREALAPYADGVSVRLRGAMWLISSAPA